MHQYLKTKNKRPPEKSLFTYIYQNSVKMQSITFQLHIGNGDKDNIAEHSRITLHVTHKCHYTENTQQLVWTLLGNQSKHSIKCTVGGLFGLLLCVSGYGGSNPTGNICKLGGEGQAVNPNGIETVYQYKNYIIAMCYNSW